MIGWNIGGTLRRLDFKYPFARMNFIETKSDLNLSYFRLERWNVHGVSLTT